MSTFGEKEDSSRGSWFPRKFMVQSVRATVVPRSCLDMFGLNRAAGIDVSPKAAP